MRLTLALLAAAASSAVQGGSSPSTDEARIRQIIAGEERAWNRGDARAYASHFEEEGGFTNVLGTVYYGRHGFEERHAPVFGTMVQNNLVSTSLEKIPFV